MSNVMDIVMSELKQPLWENWYIKEVLGYGASSSVYRIEAERSGRTDVSALKVEPITTGDILFSDPERKRQYLERKRQEAVNETNIMYKLRKCPYIVGYEEEDIREVIHEGEKIGYCLLIRMEYLQCLQTLMQKGKLDCSEGNIIKIAKDIGRGIQAAHKIGIIHRDIKPANFFVGEEGIYKLGDFNISKLSPSAKTFAGTDGYIAPEVYYAKKNTENSYTRQADIYSFGICLYQLMNNYFFPYEDKMDTLDEALDRRLKGDETLPPPKKASPEFAAVILKACAFDASERYATIDDMLRDIDALKTEVAPVKKLKKIKPLSEPDYPVFPNEKVYPAYTNEPEPRLIQQPVQEEIPVRQINAPLPPPDVNKRNDAFFENPSKRIKRQKKEKQIKYDKLTRSIVLCSVFALSGLLLYKHAVNSNADKTVSPDKSAAYDSTVLTAEQETETSTDVITETSTAIITETSTEEVTETEDKLASLKAETYENIKYDTVSISSDNYKYGYLVPFLTDESGCDTQIPLNNADDLAMSLINENRLEIFLNSGSYSGDKNIDVSVHGDYSVQINNYASDNLSDALLSYLINSSDDTITIKRGYSLENDYSKTGNYVVIPEVSDKTELEKCCKANNCTIIDENTEDDEIGILAHHSMYAPIENSDDIDIASFYEDILKTDVEHHYFEPSGTYAYYYIPADKTTGTTDLKIPVGSLGSFYVSGDGQGGFIVAYWIDKVNEECKKLSDIKAAPDSITYDVQTVPTDKYRSGYWASYDSSVADELITLLDLKDLDGTWVYRSGNVQINSFVESNFISLMCGYHHAVPSDNVTIKSGYYISEGDPSSTGDIYGGTGNYIVLSGISDKSPLEKECKTYGFTLVDENEDDDEIGLLYHDKMYSPLELIDYPDLILEHTDTEHHYYEPTGQYAYYYVPADKNSDTTDIKIPAGLTLDSDVSISGDGRDGFVVVYSRSAIK